MSSLAECACSMHMNLGHKHSGFARAI
jgi:hypothetical protein